MEIKKIENFITSKYENKNTQIKAKSYVKKGVSIFENAGIETPSENDFRIIEDKTSRSYTRSFYSWLKDKPEMLEKEGKDYSMKKRNVNFLIEDKKYQILSVLALQNNTTITAILNEMINDFFSSHNEQIERIKIFLNNA